MMDLSISQMMQMQLDLYEPHKEKWFPMEPEFGKDFVLFMVEEIGETIAILKKKGSQAIMNEMADVLMYYHDILLRFHVTPEEISAAFLQKHNFDMERNFAEEYKEKYHG